jgi:predicted DNA-binding transcriptional regulator YafY
MSTRESISRYNLIIKKLRRNPSTFAEIADYLSRESELQSYNFNTSKRTFQRDIKDIASLFNIEIQYDFSKKVYFISYEEQPEVNERILEAYDMFNAINISDRLSNYIHFEKRRPQGTENLYGLLHAIKNRFQIHFSYQKFLDEESSKRTVEPYALKEFKNRWYVFAKDLKDGRIKSYGLDRLTNMDITRKTFIFPKDYDIEKSYKYCFGIINPAGQEPEEIILSFDPIQGKYIKSLPLHETQEVILDTHDEVRVKLNVFVTFDFIMELLSFGESVKVLSPESLIKEIKTAHQKAFKQYE